MAAICIVLAAAGASELKEGPDGSSNRPSTEYSYPDAGTDVGTAPVDTLAGLAEEEVDGSNNVPSGSTDGWIASRVNHTDSTGEEEVDAYPSNVPSVPGWDGNRISPGDDVPGMVEPTPGATAPVGEIDVVPIGEPTSVAAPVPADGREELVALVHQTFPDDPHMGNHVVWGETLNLNNWRDYVYGGRMSATSDCGLMQINWPSHSGKFAARGWGLEDCFIPERNLIIAREIYDTSGPWAWTTY